MMMIFYLYDGLPLGNVYHGHQYHIAAFEGSKSNDSAEYRDFSTDGIDVVCIDNFLISKL